jgi:hypothetical protein
MKYNPEKCLEVLENAAKTDSGLLGFEAEYAIKNWKNNNWNIE